MRSARLHFIQNAIVRKCFGLLFVLVSSLCGAQVATSGLAISDVGVSGRTPFPTDAVLKRIVLGTWKAPTVGEAVTAPDGSRHVWKEIAANKDGWFEDDALNNGYVYLPLDWGKDETVDLVAQGDSAVYVNGVIHPGDPYQYGYLRIPIDLKQGRNSLLFACGRGRLHVEFKPATQPVLLNTDDLTLPDIISGQRDDLWMAAVLVNNTDSDLRGYKATTIRPDGKMETTDLPVIPAMSLRKVPIRLSPQEDLTPGNASYRLAIYNSRHEKLQGKEITLRVRQPLQTQKRTFISSIDGSVQYYGVVPAQKPSSQNVLIMTLHGASVEAIGQAEAYAPKDWCTLVAPTNRRPYGFDWEDWGRLDFNEVFSRAKKEIPHDPSRVILTGHSMGGHGTWSIGSTFPGSFAAIGPSAGWLSFWSYTGAYEPKNPNDPIEEILRRADDSSDTSTFRSNLVQPSIYILHGEKDDNVPVTEARNMFGYLKKITDRVQYHEQPGAGHWWGTPEVGAACVDWAPMFRLFQSCTIPDHPLDVDFTTVNPAVSSTCRWVSILQQQHSLAPSRVQFGSPYGGALSGKTDNVALLTLDLGQTQLWGMGLTLDGQQLPVRNVPKGPLTLKKVNGTWVFSKLPRDTEKSPVRNGPFKAAFQRNMLFVYGTRGTPEENAWAESAAKYDAESFYYRGNGAVDVIPDTAFNPGRTRDRNVIIFGNADTNAAWSELMADSPVQVKRGALGIGGRLYSGSDLSCLFVRPRNGVKDGLVAAVSGTGIVGMRTTDRLPIFLSGCEYPDWIVFRPTVLTQGPSACVAAGFFDNEWRVDSDQSAFRNRE